ncbi:very long chain fatty acid elongase AAEL008004 isoform X2 [Bactrocera oleae]|uniref:very long chain fatty acid elongase AAEL008004 isoform X2 n=1 Tax=Bactrocera oleae TaxID=104688 RepID=UPI0006B7D196|nr:elongation of very long chain fatty acids protein AAEL008004 isoform X2 [Bactrocera oleae]XP_036213034.1 elongation of very long chain fatty acids protein AAEL008004 isoform X2 [Bactrocera oleae]XP_036213035.1 elongation of very long chain fatty acids protein AAEL008004 isoform X2 [Bactrocera oleae]XP_036213036.1 elongation of very long chain fatty acids protein AAEL008004 isoform X2 [Bactrocera oleae]
MALIMKYIDSMQRYMDSHGDSRTKDWPMMSSPFPTLAVCLTYVYLVKVLGPRLMENRKPFQLQNTLIFYNAVQVIFSAWLFYECLMGGWWGHYSFRCQPVDYSDDPTTKRMVHACWWYYFSKFTEFMDTIFFVLRKKTSQVTTLHVIHHGCMPMSVWFGVKFTPGGHSTFFGLLNTFVHIVMYTYYMFSAMGPQFQKYLWWKKYLTTLQMVQFVLIMVHAFQLLFIDCNYPKAFVWWIGMHAVMFFFLFNEFYKNAYKGRRTKHKNLLMFILQRKEKDDDEVVEVKQKNSNNKAAEGEEQKALLANGHVSNGVISNGSVANGYPKNGYKTASASTTASTLINGSGASINGSVKASAGNGSVYKNGEAPLLANGHSKMVGGELDAQLTQRKLQQQQK